MLWFILALLGGLGSSINYIFFKKLSKKIKDKREIIGYTFLGTSIILYLISLLFFPGEISIEVLGVSALTGLILAWVLKYYIISLGDGEISRTVPLLGFTPIFLIFTSWIILGETPSSSGIVGIFLVVFGALLLERFSLKNILKNKHGLLMLLVAFVFSITSNLEKFVILRTNPFLGGALVYSAVSFFGFLMAKERRIETVKENIKYFLGIWGGIAATVVFMGFAFLLTIVPYAVAVKRSAILFGVLWGKLLFKEKRIKERLLGAILIFSGVVMILLGNGA